MSHFSNHVDIERAKRELGVRRTETLRRHTEEIRKLDGEQAELETLEKMLASFSQKFGQGTAASDEPENVTAAPPPVVAELPQPSPRTKYQATNFEIFSRAAAFGTF